MGVRGGAIACPLEWRYGSSEPLEPWLIPAEVAAALLVRIDEAMVADVAWRVGCVLVGFAMSANRVVSSRRRSYAADGFLRAAMTLTRASRSDRANEAGSASSTSSSCDDMKVLFKGASFCVSVYFGRCARGPSFSTFQWACVAGLLFFALLPCRCGARVPVSVCAMPCVPAACLCAVAVVDAFLSGVAPRGMLCCAGPCRGAGAGLLYGDGGWPGHFSLLWLNGNGFEPYRGAKGAAERCSQISAGLT